ncbi:MAG TPA: tetratricopeptide repeat protein [Actinomycetota bacterium]|nr:tetratricopeptide repeat protein [Actinomycetota bacterium]
MGIPDDTLAICLRGHRISAGLTQEELAERAGVSQRTISDIERGLRARMYPTTARLLAGALGLEPNERQRFEAVARGRSGHADGSARSGDRRGSNARLPVPLTRLIGRAQELGTIGAALRDRYLRLVTLTGPGGIGKTRLAVEAAGQALEGFADGVCFVPLAAIQEPGLVAPAIADALGVGQVEGALLEAIEEHLASSTVLIVLDTFEHVLEARAVVATLIAAGAGVRILVTSRAPLHLRGEREIPVPPLDLLGALDAGGSLAASPAAALFVERALAVKPDLDIGERSLGTIAEICRRLEGLPLAIELAAARARHLPLPALLARLKDRLQILTGGPTDLPGRQQAMVDTLRWSYELLREGEQVLFRRLCVFVGQFTLDAAEFVCGMPGGSDLLGGVSNLVDRSLLLLADSPDGAARYRMLDIIREFGEGLDESELLDDRHARYFLNLAEAAEPELRGPDQSTWLTRLAADRENLRAALGWAVDHAQAEIALRLAGALWMFWRLDGAFNEGRRWLDAALSFGPSAHPRPRAKALWGAAWLAYHQGAYAQAGAFGDQLLTLAQQGGDPLELRNAVTIAGLVAVAEGSYAQGVASFRDALDICRGGGPRWHLATSLFNLGWAEARAGDSDAAEVHLDEALALYRELGDRHFVARALTQAGYAALLRGDLRAAVTLSASSLEMFRELKDAWGLAEGLEAVSAVMSATGNARQAARTAGAASSIRESITTQQHPFDRVINERCLAGAREDLGEPAWSRAWAEGRSMTPEQAYEEASREAVTVVHHLSGRAGG